MAIGCVHVQPDCAGALYNSEDIASLAALAKRRAKQRASGLVVIDAVESDALMNRRNEMAPMSVG
jgi:hypothetical protein